MTTRTRAWRALMIAALTTTLTSTLAACPSSSSPTTGPSSEGGSQTHPQSSSNSTHNPSDCGYSWDPCPSSAPSSQPVQVQPIPSADAALPDQVNPYFVLNTCHLYLSPPQSGGIQVTDGIHVDGSVIIMCQTPPRTHTITIRLQKKDSTTGGWIDEAPPYVSLKIPGGGNLPQTHTTTSLCYPGLWSMDVAVRGIGTDGIPFRAEGRTPPQRITCS